MRIKQHIIDTKAIKNVLKHLPDEWVVRELTERDYGIDLFVEIFEKEGLDGNNNDQYISTGYISHLQIKGTEKRILPRGGYISYSIKKSFLQYAEKFAIPFFLFRVSNYNQKTYFIWIQRYISEVLDLEHPNWREGNTKSITIKIPKENNLELEKSKEKIKHIALRIKYLEEYSEFVEKFMDVKNYVDSINTITINNDLYKFMELTMKRLSKLKTLLKNNNVQVDEALIEGLLQAIQNHKNNNITHEELINIFNNFNIDLLLSDQDSRIGIENFIAENNGESVY